MKAEKKEQFINENMERLKKFDQELLKFEKQTHQKERLNDYGFINQVSYTRDLIKLFQKELDSAYLANDFGHEMIDIEDAFHKIEKSLDEVKFMAQ